MLKPAPGSPHGGGAARIGGDEARRGRMLPGMRAHLVALVLVVFLPALAVGGAAAWQAARASQAAFEARLRDTARALALAIENELDLHLTTATALASSPLLDGEDLDLFRDWAAVVAARLGSWVILHEAEPGHPQILNTRVPEGAPLPPPGLPGEGAWHVIRRAVEAERAAVSDLFTGRMSGAQVVAVAAPVVREGQVRRVVVLAVEPDRLARLLREQELTGSAIAGVVDGRGLIVARSRAHELLVGKPAPARATPATERQRGLFRARDAEGVPSLFFVQAVRNAPGWTVAVGEPLQAYAAGWQRPLFSLLAGGGLVLALALAAGIALARRMQLPVAALLRRAEAVTVGGTPEARQSAPRRATVAEFEALRTALERADEAIRAGEAEFRAAFEQSAVPMAQADAVSFRLLRVNPAFCRLVGRTPEELAGLRFVELTHPDDRAADLEGSGRMLRGEAPLHEIEKRYLRPDGSVRWARVSASAVRDVEGRPIRIVAVMRDITEHRQVEAALREGEERLRATYERAPVGIAETEPQTGRFVRVNDAYSRITGYAREELLAGLTVFDITPAEDAERDLARQQRLLAGEIDAYTLEKRFIRRDGGIGWAEVSVSVVRGPDGAPAHGIRIVQDVSERRRAQLALRESEERLRRAAEAARFATFDIDRDGTAVVVSDNFRAMWGLPPEARCDYDALLACVHPEDRHIVTENRQRMASTGGPFEIEFRVVWPDGSIRWLQSRGEGERGAGDRPRRLVGVNLDITERRLAEERQVLLMRELDHRAKNALAVVLAALRLTPKDDPAAFARAIEGRVTALARAHTLLAKERWRGAELRAVVEGELAPFLGSAGEGGPRATLSGPPVPLSPGAVQALSMALHELATNAAKHGALSMPSGQLEIRWAVTGTPDGDRMALSFHWIETGGPPAGTPPTRRGFGSSLIDATVARQLGGRITAAWRPEGLWWEASLPLDRLAAGREEDATVGEMTAPEPQQQRGGAASA